MPLVVRPGKSRPVYAPRTMRSISVSPSRGASRLLLRILFPKTMARCSLLSTLFVYKWRNISVPVTVGIRARTIHCTSGNVSRSFGLFTPAPPDGREESTGTLRGCSVDGVAVPGVAGGVN